MQVTDASGCSGDVDAAYIIRASPVVSTAVSFETCDQEIATSFPDATPAGGTWELPKPHKYWAITRFSQAILALERGR